MQLRFRLTAFDEKSFVIFAIKTSLQNENQSPSFPKVFALNGETAEEVRITYELFIIITGIK